MNPSAKREFDVIVIGSGIGGLTSASLLAQVKRRRVLVLERHFKLGGFTHAFQRNGVHWDVGLHYVGGMHDRALTRRFMDLVTGGAVDWSRIEDPLEHFIYPHHHIEVPSSEEAYRATLVHHFPQSKSDIDRYFRDIHRVAAWMGRWFASKQMPPWMGRAALQIGKSRAIQTTGAYLEANVRDAELRGVLASQWGDYGLPPAQSCFGIHAVVVKDYLKGGYVPVGGAQRIAEAVVPIVERAGGRCLTGYEVVRVECSGGKVSRVIARHKGEEIAFHAPLVISDAGAAATFGRLISTDREMPERDKLHDVVEPPTAVTAYLSLNRDPRSIGMQAGNYWIANSYDHDALHAGRDRLLDGQIDHCFVSSASARAAPSSQGKHNAQIICFSSYKPWQSWSQQPWLNRDAAYQQIKQRIAESAIAMVDHHLPGFASNVARCEVSTPLTVESMTGHARGAIYGMPLTSERLRQGLFHAQTSVKNLLLTGADVGTVGIVGAMMGGVMSTAWALGPLGFPRLLLAAR